MFVLDYDYALGIHAYNASSDATAFNDGGQGGLIVIVGPINAYGRTTQLSIPKGGRYVMRTMHYCTMHYTMHFTMHL